MPVESHQGQASRKGVNRVTLTELRQCGKTFVSVYDVAPILECDPQKLRDALDIDDELPIENRRFLFPHCKVGNRRKIGLDGFIRWVDGDLNPAVVIWKMKNGDGLK